MYIQPALLPQAKKIRASPVLSREATRRLRWMEYYLSHGRNAKLTYRHFGISSATFYRWWPRYDPRRLESLEDDWGTRRPHAVRQPETPPALEAAIRTVREHYPRWGKVKLRLLLRRDGWTVSESTTFTDCTGSSSLAVYPAGLVGLSGVSVTTSGGKIDSFLSSAGVYGPSNHGSAALVMSNGTLSFGGVTLLGSTISTQGTVSVADTNLHTHHDVVVAPSTSTS